MIYNKYYARKYHNLDKRMASHLQVVDARHILAGTFIYEPEIRFLPTYKLVSKAKFINEDQYNLELQ